MISLVALVCSHKQDTTMCLARRHRNGAVATALSPSEGCGNEVQASAARLGCRHLHSRHPRVPPHPMQTC